MGDVKAATRLAKVVHMDDPGYAAMTYGPLEVVINRGSGQGLKLGDRFLVFGIGPHIVDPDTGKDLGELERVRGQGVVVHVQDEIATIRSIRRPRTRPAKRIIRDAGTGLVVSLFSSGKIIEEELSPETEMPFEGVCLGDFAKAI